VHSDFPNALYTGKLALTTLFVKKWDSRIWIMFIWIMIRATLDNKEMSTRIAQKAEI
jgi:hypothetical protein